MLRLIKKKTCLQLHNFPKIKYITLSTFRLHLASTKPESIKVDQYPLNYIGFELVLLTLVTPSLGLEPSTIFNFFYFKNNATSVTMSYIEKLCNVKKVC